MNDRNERLRFGMLVGAALATSLGCGEQQGKIHDCTTRDCGPSVSLELEATHWAPGEYVIFIETTALSFECRFTRGMTGSGGQAGGPAEVAGMVHRCAQVSGEPIEPSPALHGDENVSIDFIEEYYDQLRIRVQRDGAVLLDDEVTPEYRTSYPNGPDCGACSNADPITLTVPAED